MKALILLVNEMIIYNSCNCIVPLIPFRLSHVQPITYKYLSKRLLYKIVRRGKAHYECVHLLGFFKNKHNYKLRFFFYLSKSSISFIISSDDASNLRYSSSVLENG